MKFSRYKDVESFLFNQLPMYQRVGPKAFKKDLKNIKHLCDILGNPQNDFKAIHIAGTNGKGSTSFFIATALNACGYNVGLYTSPHYRSYRERIRYNGEMISKSYVKKFVNELFEKDVFENDLKPSFFEITVAMAFCYFRDLKLDYAVIETGLGGRLDSTNLVHPVITAITNISLDHVQFLGNTLNMIAKEKAGIIKQNCPVIIGRRQKETEDVFKQTAGEKNAPLIYAEEFSCPLPSELTELFPVFQIENMRTACCLLTHLIKDFNVDTLIPAWTDGLRKWNYVGRFQIINKTPKIILDSAHNADGLSTLFDQIEKEHYAQLHIVIAVVNDKDLDKIFTYLPEEAKYYVSQAKIPRAKDRYELLKLFHHHGLNAKGYFSIPKAMASAKLSADPNDLILATGSIFTVAELV